MKPSGANRWRVLAFVLVIGLLAAACSGGDDGGEGQDKSGGPVELTLEDHQKPRVELLHKLPSSSSRWRPRAARSRSS